MLSKVCLPTRPAVPLQSHLNTAHGPLYNATTAQKSAHHTQHSTEQHSTAQHSTAQRSAAQHSTAQHSTAQRQGVLTCTAGCVNTIASQSSFSPCIWRAMCPRGRAFSVSASKAFEATKHATRASKLRQVDVRLKSKRCLSFFALFCRTSAYTVTLPAPVRLYRRHILGLFSLFCNSWAQAITKVFQHIAQTLALFATLCTASSMHSHTSRILLYCAKQPSRQKSSVLTTMQSSINSYACHAM